MTTITVLTFDPAAVNSGIITGADRTLIVDSSPGPDTAARLVERAQELSRAANEIVTPIDLVITHDHWDHHLGAAALVAAGIDRVFASPAFAADQAASTWISLDALRTNPDTADFAASLPEDPGDLLVEVTPHRRGGCGAHGGRPRRLPRRTLGARRTFHGRCHRQPPRGRDRLHRGPRRGGLRPAGRCRRVPEPLGREPPRALALPGAEVFVPGHGVPVDRAFVERQLEDIDGFRLASVPGQRPDTDLSTGVSVPTARTCGRTRRSMSTGPTPK